MNISKVSRAIKVIRNSKQDEHVQDIVKDCQTLLAAIEEIASEDNTETLRLAIDALSYKSSDEITTGLSKLLLLLQSVQVPKELVYAYPVTLHLHFIHYRSEWCSKNSRSAAIETSFGLTIKDGFGCEWRKFTAPKEMVDYLRENNVPIKAIQ